MFFQHYNSLAATKSMGDNGFENNSSSKSVTLLLKFSETNLEITFTCVIFTITFFGAIGNLAAIGKIIYDPKNHTPTFAVIGQLALADFLSVTTTTFIRMTNIWEIWFHIIFISNTSILSSYYYHVCFLSVVRYLITVHPLQSRQYLTVTAVCLCSLTIWISSGVVGTCFTIFRTSNTFLGRIIIDVVLLLTVLFIMILLHVKKIRSLQNSLSVTEQSQRRMNSVVTVIISIFAILQIIIISNEILLIIYFQLFSDEIVIYIIYISFCRMFFECLNFSCNPYILFFSQFI
ncbi:trace amine-associated receptor 8-like [Crassostrea angulata]|uniref:trace amine-associated receptor 8-like n=1 Tax=Magallana angulata TaxID=2784310 RepID=UPI0022B17F61|nr:trace amine-associated receptor 8-like [Crassostrea angulata]